MLRASSIPTSPTFVNVNATTITTTTIVTANRTVATLPAAASNAWARMFVTDASAPTFGSTVVGGGAVKTPVWSDGTNWIVG